MNSERTILNFIKYCLKKEVYALVTNKSVYPENLPKRNCAAENHKKWVLIITIESYMKS
jgi:hypothetical protein